VNPEPVMLIWPLPEVEPPDGLTPVTLGAEAAV
jgi:hypothetical protein